MPPILAPTRQPAVNTARPTSAPGKQPHGDKHAGRLVPYKTHDTRTNGRRRTLPPQLVVHVNDGLSSVPSLRGVILWLDTHPRRRTCSDICAPRTASSPTHTHVHTPAHAAHMHQGTPSVRGRDRHNSTRIAAPKTQHGTGTPVHWHTQKGT